MKSSDSATMVFSTVFGPAIDCERADGAELELVAGEGERAGAVAVAGVARQLGQHRDADLHEAALLGALGAALLELVDDVLELVAQEDRDDRRRRLVGAEAVVVGGAARPTRAAVRDTWPRPG